MPSAVSICPQNWCVVAIVAAASNSASAAVSRRRRTAASASRDFHQQRRDRIGARAGRGGIAQALGAHQPLADPFAQFLRGFTAEGDQQQLRQAGVALGDVWAASAAIVNILPVPAAGLEHGGAGGQLAADVERGRTVQNGRHRSTSAASRGRHSRSARSPNRVGSARAGRGEHLGPDRESQGHGRTPPRRVPRPALAQPRSASARASSTRCRHATCGCARRPGRRPSAAAAARAVPPGAGRRGRLVCRGRGLVQPAEPRTPRPHLGARPTVTARHRRSGCAAVSATSAPTPDPLLRGELGEPARPPPRARRPRCRRSRPEAPDATRSRRRRASRCRSGTGRSPRPAPRRRRAPPRAPACPAAGWQLAAPLRGAAANVQTGEPVAQQPVADRPALEGVEGDGQGVGRVVVDVADGRPTSAAGTASPDARR